MPFELTILGSSSAVPTSDRYPTAQILNISERFFLIDCGEGTQIQLRKQKISFSKIKHVFISHLHGDHYFGLIGLISTMNLLGIKNDLHIYSHSELKQLLQPQLDFIKGDVSVNVIFHPLNFKKPQKIYSDKRVEIYSFPVKHSISTCGFLFKEIKKEANIKKEAILNYNIPVAQIKAIKKGADFITDTGEAIPNKQLTIPPKKPRSYAFCTDTAYHEPIIEWIKGVNLLYHEATFPEEMKEFAQKTLHSTAKDAARIAKSAKVKKLILGHFSTRYTDVAVFENEAREIFKNTITATDGKVYKIAQT